VISSARTDEVLKVIVANPAMIKAYKAGVPGNGQPFPDANLQPQSSCGTDGDRAGKGRGHTHAAGGIVKRSASAARRRPLP